jgi:aldehyde:ferredoxin oxidoreductase
MTELKEHPMTSQIYGYAGKQLRIQLETQETIIENIPSGILRQYLGGAGYGVRILYDELAVGIDPLGSDNIMVIATGPLSLAQIPGGGSVMLCFKSPLTRIWGESRAGSDFGPNLKKAGFDFIIIKGKSPTPIYLFIDDGKVEIRGADHLLGKLVSEKSAILRGEVGDKRASVMCIGPAGERLVKIASVMSDDRAAGRCGGGAVWGSKNLIAVVVKGKNKIIPAEPDRFKSFMKATFDEISENPMFIGLKNYGTIGDIPANDDGGDWPSKNWQSNSWGEGPEIYDKYTSSNFIKGFGCYKGCTLACARQVHVNDGNFVTPQHGGAEYESISCFTAYVLNDNMDAAVNSTWLCNELGLDTISTGAMIAFAMDCSEQGLLSNKLIDGLDLRWGNAELLPVLVKKIAYRESLGDLLAEGVRNAAKIIGNGAEDLAIHVKGLEGPAHDPRSGKALGITYATGNRGMCHIQPLEGMAWDSGKLDWGLQKYGLPDPNSVERWGESSKGHVVPLLQNGLSLPDILGTCKFYMYAGVTVDHLAEMVSLLTGWEINGIELMKISERCLNLQRMFNVREGITPKDDHLPQRIKMVPSFGKYQSEPNCVIHDLDALLAEYYETRGWDPVTGAPTLEKQKELGLI